MTPSSPLSSSPSPSPSPSLWVANQCHCQNDDEKFWSRTNTRVSVKDAGSMVLGLSQNLRLYLQFLALVKRGSKPNKEEEEKQDY
ncbi:hypothetical protein CXB51_034878 [Gossypium anomalum]|uniref:Uncharacterized protein n=1 Tax=Gossypium anomalum TaxID=47600 RepID=A0A8J5XX84_9ROSI|nr:hypothetical protein CXB51_034878 [Gossypium anomalum]